MTHPRCRIAYVSSRIPIPGLPDRRSVRMRTYDYATAGIYFVTVCTHGKRCVLGRVTNDRVVLSRIGAIVDECWRAIPEHFAGVELHEFVVMPNHLHGLIILPEAPRAQHAVPLRNKDVLAPERSFGAMRPGELSAIVRSFKSACTKRVNRLRRTSGRTLWQRGYYEHVVRDADDLEQLQRYIIENPLSWVLNRENPLRGK